MTTKAKPTAGAFAVSYELPAQRVADTLCCALEGGTGYWAQIDNEKGPGYGAGTCEEIAAGRAHLLIIEDCGEGDKPKTYTLDRAALSNGLRIMAREYPRHLAAIVGENEDAETGDVLLQLALLGKIVYG